MNSSRIGRGMRAIRIRTNLTQQVVATRAGVPRGVVASLERGNIGRVRVEQLLAVPPRCAPMSISSSGGMARTWTAS